MASTVDILLRLLKASSAEKVEVMLEPHVLLHLWLDHGHAKADMEAKLKRGTKPGELLLELFEAHGADALWESLPPRMRQIASPADKKAPKLTQIARDDPPTKWERYLAVAGLSGAVWSAMWIVGMFPEWGQGVSLGPVVSALLGGSTCGAMLSSPRTAGAVGGFAGGGTVVLVAMLAHQYLDAPPGRLVCIGVTLVGVLLGLLVTISLRALLTRGRTAPPKTF